MRRKRIVLYFSIFALLIAFLIAAGRTQYVSNYLKEIATPELETIIGKKINIGDIYVNIIPFFIQIDNVSAIENSGEKIFSARRIKGYISLTGLIGREIIIKRIAADDIKSELNKQQIKEISSNIKRYLAKEREDSFKINVRSLLIRKSAFDFHTEKQNFSLEVPYAEILAPADQSYKVSLSKIKVSATEIPETVFSADAVFLTSNETINIKKLNIDVDGSEQSPSGKESGSAESSQIRKKEDVISKTVKKFLGLQKEKNGNVQVSGLINMPENEEIKDIFVDLKIKGNFYIEILMALLNVKEKIEGFVFVDGLVKGRLNDLRAEAKTEMRSGNLFGVVIDSVECKVMYSDKKMKFLDGDARIYGGSAKAEAMITLPVVVYYTFNVQAKNIKSKGVFELIGWDPGIEEGRVDGWISNEGGSFNPKGEFFYRKDHGGKDVLKRVALIDGSFSMNNRIVSFDKMKISTGKSSLTTSGSVDLNKSSLYFSGNGMSSDLCDLACPYFMAVSGAASFSVKLAGSTSDPELDVRFGSNDISFNSGAVNLSEILRANVLRFNMVEGAVTYRKNLLSINTFRASSSGMIINTKGRILFRRAQYLFDIDYPEYDLKINFDRGDIKDLASIIKNSPDLKGVFSADFTLTGVGSKSVAAGSFNASDIMVSDSRIADKLEATLTFSKREFNFRSFVLRKGRGMMRASGTIALDGGYSISASVNNLDLYDFLPSLWKERLGERKLKNLTLIDIEAKGKGTISAPELDAKGLIRHHDPNRRRSTGYGKIHLAIKKREVSFVGNFMGEKIRMSGSAVLNEKLPWSLGVEFRSARADFLASLMLKDVPEDLLVNIKGEIKLWGQKNNVNGAIKFDKIHLYGYGYGFTNSSPVSLTLQDKFLEIESLIMKNELAEVSISGNAAIGKSFNLSINGASSLAPLRLISKNIDLLKGDASFSFKLSGDWNSPRFNGGMDIVNGSIGLKKIPHRITAINARIIADGDKIVLENARGSVSGGYTFMNGVLYLDGFGIKRFFMDTKFSNVTISVSRNFWVHSEGKLTLHGDKERQNISGEININKARYTERVDWKSWLIQTGKNEPIKIGMEQGAQTALNVRVKGANLSIDNNILRAAVKLDLLLKGTLGQPALLGRVETSDGVLYFRNNEFNILKGIVDFSKPGEIKPFFDVIAETRVRDYSIRLALDGHADQFNLTLTSTPSLEEGDILSLLAAGDLSRNLKGMQGGIGAGEAASFLTGKLQDVVEDRLKTVTGLDRLQIDPSVSKKTGAVSPRVTISKRLLGDKLYATYSTSADVEEGQIIKLEYILNKHTSLVGMRDERGGIGGDIKFRFQFK